jgi:alanine racemase
VSGAEARVSLAAIEANCGRLRDELSEGCALCAVVKADGYGHGALPAAEAALRGGASWLAVATAEEGLALRDGAREDAEPSGVAPADVPILVMGAPPEGLALETALAGRCDLVVWREEHVERIAGSEVVELGGGEARVHVKLDSGMGRYGTRDPAQARRVAELALQTDGIELAGLMTHFATADQAEDGGFMAAQLEAFTALARELKARHPRLIVHAANSAAVLREREAHFDMVRCGIAVYGMDPFHADASARGLVPALELRSHVAEVKRCRRGQSAGYGRRFIAEEDTWLGVVPIGYGDGYRRGLSNNADVLVAGRRRPVVGTLSMDSLTIDLGPDPASERLRGEEAVLIGAQGGERISAEELASRLGTINYEITCGLTPRVARRHCRDGAPER